MTAALSPFLTAASSVFGISETPLVLVIALFWDSYVVAPQGTVHRDAIKSECVGRPVVYVRLNIISPPSDLLPGHLSLLFSLPR